MNHGTTPATVPGTTIKKTIVPSQARERSVMSSGYGVSNLADAVRRIDSLDRCVGTPCKRCFSNDSCVEVNGTGLLVDVWASAPDDVWAVAQDRTLYRFDGHGPARGSALSIFGRAKNDVWVGLEKTVAHFDGTTWTSESVSAPSAMLGYAVETARRSGNTASAPTTIRCAPPARTGRDKLERAPRGLFAMSIGADNKAWALGDGPVLASYDGTTWKTHPTADVKDMISLAYVSPTVVRLMQKNGGLVARASTTRVVASRIGRRGT